MRGLRPVGGGYSLAELPGEITTAGQGQVRAFFINAGNPVASGPDGDSLDAALSSLDLLVGIDLLMRESHRHADWLIPGSHFLERTELHVYLHCMNDRPFIMSSKAVLPPPDGVLFEWEFFARLAKALGLGLFGGALDTPDALSSGMLATGGGLTLDQIRAAPHGLLFGERSFGHLWAHLDARGQPLDICPESLAAALATRLDEPFLRPDATEFPYQLISRRRNGTMNSWLSDTIGILSDAEGSEVVEMNGADAARAGLSDGQSVRVSSAFGSLQLELRVTDTLRPGVLLVEHGWGSRVYTPTGEVGRVRGEMRNRLVGGDDLDPATGVPRLNGQPVMVCAV